MVLDRPDDWVLPSQKTLNLEIGELLLLDWIFCSASNLIPGIHIDELMANYHDFRMRIWKAFTEMKGSLGEIAINPGLMRELMTLVPTTFRWGTGPDVGYTLKMKIARELLSEATHL